MSAIKLLLSALLIVSVSLSAADLKKEAIPFPVRPGLPQPKDTTTVKSGKQSSAPHAVKYSPECTDFYNHVCSPILAHPPAWLEDDETYGSLKREVRLKERLSTLINSSDTVAHSRTHKLLYRFYDKCAFNDGKGLTVQTQREEQQAMKEYMKERFGFWPMFDEPSDRDDFTPKEVAELLAKLVLSGVSFPLLLDETVEEGDTLIVKIIGPSEDDGLGKKDIDTLLTRALRMHGKIVFDDANLKAIEEMNEIANLLHVESSPTKYTMNDIQNHFPQINWDHFWTTVTKTANRTRDASNIQFHFTSPRAIEVINQKMSEGKGDAVRNFLMLLASSNRYVNRSPEGCFGFLKRYMSQGLIALYERKYMPNISSHDHKAHWRKNIRSLFSAFEDMIKEKEWIDEESRARMYKKAESTHIVYGFPPFMYRDDTLDEYHKDLDFPENSTLQAMMDSLLLWSASKDFIRWIDADDMGRAKLTSEIQVQRSMTFNAAHLFSANAMVIPFVAMESFEEENLPHAWLFGTIGFVIGHELTHAFDADGSKHDGKGRSVNLFSNETEAHYYNHTQCFIDQYNKEVTVIANVSIPTSGEKVRDEALADNGGAEIAFRAYKKLLDTNATLKKEEEERLKKLGYTPEQAFYYYMARTWCTRMTEQNSIYQGYLAEEEDEHPSSPLRVNPVLKNQPEFAQAFNCPVGAPMNPVHKCDLW